jgi:hypothetical protein
MNMKNHITPQALMLEVEGDFFGYQLARDSE